jgi:phenylacetate-CoA ligase
LTTTPDLTRAFGRTLAETEWLSPEKLRLYQAPLIAKLLRHARETTDFYRGRFDFDLDDPDAIERHWPSIPILTRAEAVTNCERLFSRFLPPEAGKVRAGETSGSTATPLRYRENNLTFTANQALTERMMRWWKVDGAQPCARIMLDREGKLPNEGATLYGWHSAHPRALCHTLPSTTDVETQTQWLAAHKAPYLMTYPSLAREIALACRHSGLELKYALVCSFGMLVDQEVRDLCRSVFGADIADTYGSMEAGHFAAQCPQCGEYHVSAEVARVEVLRDDGSPARCGEIGRVIVTPLYNYAMPLLRYEIGDLAEAGPEHARCRRGLPSLRRILGRYRNVFRFRDGKIRSASSERYRLREFLPLKQVQIVQLDLDRIEIRWVSDGTERPLDLAALTEQVRSVLQQPVEVSVREVDSIERSRSGKFEDCISLVPRDWPSSASNAPPRSAAGRA